MVSRPEKVGSTDRAVYFHVTNDSNVPTGEAYLFVFPGFESVFPGTGDIGTSSDPIDDVLNGLLNKPSYTVTGSLSAFSACAGSHSATQTLSVSGKSLTAAIVVTAPTGYEVSLSSSSGFGASVSITPASGAVSATTIYVRLSATATNGVSGNVTFTSSGAATQYFATGTATVSAAPTVVITPASASIAPGGNVSLTASGASTYSWSPSTGLSSASGATVTASPSTTTIYTVIATSAAGCTGTKTVTVTVTAGLNGGVVTGDQIICVGQTPAAFGSTSGAGGGGAATLTSGSKALITSISPISPALALQLTRPGRSLRLLISVVK